MAKDLADLARRLAGRAYQSNDHVSQEKAALYAFHTTIEEDLQLKCAEKGCKKMEQAVDIVEIQEHY